MSLRSERSVKTAYQPLYVDDSLIMRIAHNDRDAFRELYETAHTAVYAYALSVLKNRDDACDVMQETFLKIRGAAHLYKPSGKASAWIFTICRNLCNMRFRESSRFSGVSPDDIRLKTDTAAPEDIAMKVTLEKAFTVLNDEERQVILLHAAGGMKHREIAQVLHMPLATVLSKYHRGLKKMRGSLEGVRDE